MGLKNNPAATYLKIKDGKFYRTTDKELLEPFTELEGKITNINFRTDEWEGNDIEKLVITINDGEEDYIISFSFDSYYMSSVVGFLKNADLSEVLSLVPVQKEYEKGKFSKSLLVKQGGKFLKGAYKKEDGNVPEITPVMKGTKQLVVNGRGVWDKEAYHEFYRKVINEELRPELSTDKPAPVAKKATQASILSDTDTDSEEVEDGLPF